MVSKAFLKQFHKTSVKTFLWKLYQLDPEERSAKGKKTRLLQNAFPVQVEVLLRLLHYVVNGIIPLKQKHLERVVKSKRLPHLVKLKSKENLEKLLDSNLETQKTYLRQINTYRQYLHAIFNMQ